MTITREMAAVKLSKAMFNTLDINSVLRLATEMLEHNLLQMSKEEFIEEANEFALETGGIDGTQLLEFDSAVWPVIRQPAIIPDPAVGEGSCDCDDMVMTEEGRKYGVWLSFGNLSLRFQQQDEGQAPLMILDVYKTQQEMEDPIASLAINPDTGERLL